MAGRKSYRGRLLRSLIFASVCSMSTHRKLVAIDAIFTIETFVDIWHEVAMGMKAEQSRATEIRRMMRDLEAHLAASRGKNTSTAGKAEIVRLVDALESALPAELPAADLEILVEWTWQEVATAMARLRAAVDLYLAGVPVPGATR